jgi:multidrug efflux pump subunit AcrB
VASQNAQFAAGKIGAAAVANGPAARNTPSPRAAAWCSPRTSATSCCARRRPNGVLRLKDVARIELGAQSYDQPTASTASRPSRWPCCWQSGANALDVADAVKAKHGRAQARPLPQGRGLLRCPTTPRSSSGLDQGGQTTIVEAALIVLAVVFLFLQTWRATLIPMLAVPVSLIGTFAGLQLFGFSINTLTLFAMVLAIGIVVDDAIVVLENVERLIREQKMAPMEAAIEAMREVQGAVIGIVLVLCAVFIPVAFLGGIAGQLYRQFAVTVTVAVVLSGVVALTLTPALCALLLKPGTMTRSRLFKPFNRGFGWVTDALHGRGAAGPAPPASIALAAVRRRAGRRGLAAAPRCRAASCRRRPGLPVRRGAAARRRHAGAHRGHHRPPAADASRTTRPSATSSSSTASTSSAAAARAARPPSSCP